MLNKKTLVGGLLCLSCAFSALADVTYEEEMKMSGIMRMLVGTHKTVTRISGDKMRVDSDQQAQIIDLGEEKIYTLDTKKKTYSVMTFAEMRRRMEEGLAQANQAMKESESQGSGDVTGKTDIKVTETENRQTIGGYACQQYLMEMAVELEDQKSGEQGQFSTLMELWLTHDAPAVDEINAFHRNMAEKLGTAEIGRQFLSGGGNEQTNAFAADMQEMSAQAVKLDGFIMRTVFYFGSPEAAKQEALQDAGKEEKPKGGGLGGFLKKMAPVPSAGSEGGGPSGGGIMMKMTDEVKKIETKEIASSLLAVPEDYKQVEPQ